MSSRADHQKRSEPLSSVSIERRAAALVNPASGLANDFLNVYNEILMLIEMLPSMPELADDILAWRPCSYRAYFMQSQLPGRREALDLYADLDSSFRVLFESSVELLAESSVGAVRRIAASIAMGAPDGDEEITQLCVDCLVAIRRQLDATEQLVNHGRITHRRNPQDVVNELFSAA